MKFINFFKMLLLGGFVASSFAACTDLEVRESDSVFIEDTGSGLSFDGPTLLASAYDDLGAFTDQANIYALTEHSSDEMIPPTRGVDWGDNGVWRTLHAHTWDPTHSWNQNAWNQLNQRAFKCDQILAATSPAASDVEKAEAKFLRAWNTFYVMDLWGQVPRRGVSDGPSVNPVVLDRKAAFDFIKKDLEDAVAVLPNGGPATENPKATKAAAYALLTRLILNQKVYTGSDGDYAKVVEYANQVTGLGFDLDSDYFNTFTNAGSSEKIFTSPSGSPQNRWFMTLHYNQDPSGWNGFTTLAEFYDKFSAGDQRLGVPAKKDGSPFAGIAKGFLIGQQYKGDGSVLIDSRSQKPLDFTRDVTLAGAATEKGIRVIKYHPADAGKYILLRLGEVWLNKAEAQLRANDNAGALATVNALRAKRGAAPLGSIDLNGMLDERGRELYWEGIRRMDQVRFGTFTSTWTEKSNTEAHRVLYPVPQQAIDSNPNLRQNDGY